MALLTLTGIGGAFIGGYISGLINAASMKKLFGAMLILSGLASLLKKRREVSKSRP